MSFEMDGSTEAQIDLFDRLEFDSMDEEAQEAGCQWETGLFGRYSNIISVQVRDHYAYIVSTAGDVAVVDISDPANPTEAGYLYVDYQPSSMFVQEHYAYIVCYHSALYIIDVSDVTQPHETALLSIPGNGRDIFVEGSYAYATFNQWDFMGLHIVDIRDGADPREVSVFTTEDEAWGVWSRDGLVYVNGRGEMWIIDVTLPSEPSLLGHCNDCAADWDIFVQDTYAYTVGGYEIKIVDISDPAQPRLVGAYEPPGRAYEIFVREGTAYVADDWEGLLILDVSNPSFPREVMLYETGQWTTTVVAFQDYLFVGDSEGLRIFNLACL